MHREFLQMAIDLACDNVKQGRGGPYAALIVKNHRVVAKSGNAVTAQLDPTAHAEIVAIRLACRQLKTYQLNDCILYTSCEPCPMCLGAIYWARLSQVFFACNRFDAAAAGFDDRFIYDEITKQPGQRHIAMRQLPLPSADQPFRLWSEQPNKQRY